MTDKVVLNEACRFFSKHLSHRQACHFRSWQPMIFIKLFINEKESSVLIEWCSLVVSFLRTCNLPGIKNIASTSSSMRPVSVIQDLALSRKLVTVEKSTIDALYIQIFIGRRCHHAAIQRRNDALDHRKNAWKNWGDYYFRNGHTHPENRIWATAAGADRTWPRQFWFRNFKAAWCRTISGKCC